MYLVDVQRDNYVLITHPSFFLKVIPRITQPLQDQAAVTDGQQESECVFQHIFFLKQEFKAITKSNDTQKLGTILL